MRRPEGIMSFSWVMHTQLMLQLGHAHLTVNQHDPGPGPRAANVKKCVKKLYDLISCVI